MSVRYVNFKHFKRGVPHATREGAYKGCSQNHGERAYWTATRKQDKFRLPVNYCEACAEIAKGMS